MKIWNVVEKYGRKFLNWYIKKNMAKVNIIVYGGQKTKKTISVI